VHDTHRYHPSILILVLLTLQITNAMEEEKRGQPKPDCISALIRSDGLSEGESAVPLHCSVCHDEKGEGSLFSPCGDDRHPVCEECAAHWYARYEGRSCSFCRKHVSPQRYLNAFVGLLRRTRRWSESALFIWADEAEVEDRIRHIQDRFNIDTSPPSPDPAIWGYQRQAAPPRHPLTAEELPPPVEPRRIPRAVRARLQHGEHFRRRQQGYVLSPSDILRPADWATDEGETG